MKKTYHAYLLRFWEGGDRACPAWLASLEDPHTRRVIHFRSLEELWRYLEEQTRLPEEVPPRPADQGKEEH
jgi:hypothetical protein